MYLTIIHYLIPVFLLAGFLPFFSKRDKDVMSIMIISFFILFLLLKRELSAPTDFANYLHMYNQTNTLKDALSVYHENYTFSILMYLGRLVQLTPETFFYILPFLYFTFYFFGVKYIFNRLDYTLLTMTLFVLSTTFILLYLNVIRQGLALSLYILSIGVYLKNKKIPYLILIMAIFAHSSMFVLVPIFFLSVFLIKKRIDPRKVFLLTLISPIIGLTIVPVVVKVLGGAIEKLQFLSGYEYENKLVIFKIILSYVFSILSMRYGTKQSLFKNDRFKFIFFNYCLILMICLFTFKYLIISSRFIYFLNGLIPLLMTHIFITPLKSFKINKRITILYLAYMFYGLFIYNFESVIKQLLIIN